jgi:hypothetical protein
MFRRLPLLLLSLLGACAPSPPPAVLPLSMTTREAKAPYMDPYCTRTLGQPDCWRNPQVLPNEPAELADVPHAAMPGGGWTR